MVESPSQHHTYRPEIDGMRTLAVSGVILYHAELAIRGQSLFSGGFLGVDVFFVISGYLITSILLRDMAAGRFSFADFFERRMRRLLPALLTVLVAVMVAGLALLVPSRLEMLGRTLLSTLSFGSNFFFLNHAGYFAYKSAELPLLHTWSLAVEEQFYLVFPPLLLLLWKYGRTRIQPVLLTLFVLSLTAAQVASHKTPDAAFYLLPFRFWELLAGSLLARLEVNAGRRAGAGTTTPMPWVGLTMVCYSFLRFERGMLHPSLTTLIPVVGTMLVIWFSSPGDRITRFVGNRVMVSVGLASYSLYLWHFPVFSLFHLKGGWDTPFGKLGSIALAGGLAFLTYRFVETPFRRKSIVPTRTLLRSVAGAAVVLASFGLVAVSTNGLSQWNRDADLEIAAFDKDTQDTYLQRRFVAALGRPFDAKKPVRLLIIGDSFGMDLVNALAEVGALENVSLATHMITAQCGNVVAQGAIRSFVPEQFVYQCTPEKSYQAASLQPLLAEADVIWLASSWIDYVARALPASIEALEARTAAKILVLGRKSFGDFRPEQYLGRTFEEKRRATVKSQWLDVNDGMVGTIPASQFVNVQALLCGGEECPVFDRDARLISYDGSHLTRSGAILLGEKLLKVGVVREALRLGGGS